MSIEIRIYREGFETRLCRRPGQVRPMTASEVLSAYWKQNTLLDDPNPAVFSLAQAAEAEAYLRAHAGYASTTTVLRRGGVDLDVELLVCDVCDVGRDEDGDEIDSEEAWDESLRQYPLISAGGVAEPLVVDEEGEEEED